MAGEKLTLPKLPPGKRVEQVLAMSEVDFAEVAKGAKMTPDELRERLQKIIARSTPEGQKEAEDTASKRARERRQAKVIKGDTAPKVFSAEAGFHEGLKRFLFVNERGASEADERAVFERADNFGQNSAGERHATRLYHAAYRIQLMRKYERSLEMKRDASPILVHKQITNSARDEQNRINFEAQREGYYLAIEEFQTLASPTLKDVQALHDALQNGTPLSPGQKVLMQRIMNRSSEYDRRFYELASVVWKVYNDNGIKEAKGGVAVGGMTGFSGGSAYYPHSRPHRDDHDASGGEDDK